jgi:HrpA-like RNA helicase
MCAFLAVSMCVQVLVVIGETGSGKTTQMTHKHLLASMR